MKIAICPGSFDPVTKGHLDIIRRTASMFDRVIVVVMHNYHKPNSYFSAIERVELITRCVKDLDNVVVDMHDGLLAAYAQEKGAVAIVKGLRAVGFVIAEEETYRHEHSADAAADLAHSAHSAAERRGEPERGFDIESRILRKRAEHRLRAVVSLVEKLACLVRVTCFHFNALPFTEDFSRPCRCRLFSASRP